MTTNEALERVYEEFTRATSIHGKFNSAHEGFAVLKEEVDELWDEVKRRDKIPDHLRKEAVQVAAMALRFLVDIIP
jgi:hypothetical protein